MNWTKLDKDENKNSIIIDTRNVIDMKRASSMGINIFSLGKGKAGDSLSESREGYRSKQYILVILKDTQTI